MVARSLCCLSLLIASNAAGQLLTVDATDRFAWTESAGYLNLAPAVDEAWLVICDTYVFGYTWSESLGWVSFGQVPENGAAYTNEIGSDSGVNVDPAGRLIGFAWSEGGGWINFDTTSNEDVPDARIDFDGLRLRGWAWGESIGWVNFDDDETFV
ncbi:MAG: hypothetical protein AAFO89_09380, partial [Planctomycetota bacterium]